MFGHNSDTGNDPRDDSRHSHDGPVEDWDAAASDDDLDDLDDVDDLDDAGDGLEGTDDDTGDASPEVPFEPGLPDDVRDDAPDPPDSGDAAVDAAMADLAAAQSGSFEERIAAGERAHRTLQGRLGGLGEA